MNQNNYLDFKGKTIVVTGASSGIGQGTAILLSKFGANLILIARRENMLKQTVSMLEGSNHTYYSMDLADVSSIENEIKTIVKDNGAVDGLVYAAGIKLSLPLHLFRPEKVQEVFGVNYFGFIETVRQFSKKGRFHPNMRIVVLSSTAAKCGEKTNTAYSASKAALDASVRCMAKELAEKHIYVNSIAPAMTETDIFREYCKTNGEEAKNELLKRQYLGIGKVEDVANAIAFLLSDGAKFMTGSCMAYDGGFTST